MPACSPKVFALIAQLKARQSERRQLVDELQRSLKAKAKREQGWGRSHKARLATIKLQSIKSKMAKSEQLIEQLEVACRDNR